MIEDHIALQVTCLAVRLVTSVHAFIEYTRIYTNEICSCSRGIFFWSHDSFDLSSTFLDTFPPSSISIPCSCALSLLWAEARRTANPMRGFSCNSHDRPGISTITTHQHINYCHWTFKKQTLCNLRSSAFCDLYSHLISLSLFRTHTHACTHMRKRTYVRIHAYICYTHIYVHVSTPTHAHIHIHTHTNTHTHTRPCIHIYTNI